MVRLRNSVDFKREENYFLNTKSLADVSQNVVFQELYIFFLGVFIFRLRWQVEEPEVPGGSLYGFPWGFFAGFPDTKKETKKCI